MNDYHVSLIACHRRIQLTSDPQATVAPLYLLPQVSTACEISDIGCADRSNYPQIIPVSVSLHNAEFQGLWPLGTLEEQAEVSGVFNLPRSVVAKYVQFGTLPADWYRSTVSLQSSQTGSTFNLLHVR